MAIRFRSGHTLFDFWCRTISAQLHALGCVAMLVGGAYLLPLAYESGGWPHYWACASFILTGSLVFLASSVVHFVGDGFEVSHDLHRFLENLDHFSIYLFIAGTYTPVILSGISVPWRAPLLVAIWTIACLGITYTSVKTWLPAPFQSRYVHTGIFVLMGWTLVIRINEVVFDFSPERFFLLAAGGAAYSVGAVVYALQRPKLFKDFFGYHELWHTLVLVGATYHYLLILSFYRPA